MRASIACHAAWDKASRSSSSKFRDLRVLQQKIVEGGAFECAMSLLTRTDLLVSASASEQKLIGAALRLVSGCSVRNTTLKQILFDRGVFRVALSIVRDVKEIGSSTSLYRDALETVKVSVYGYDNAEDMIRTSVPIAIDVLREVQKQQHGGGGGGLSTRGAARGAKEDVAE